MAQAAALTRQQSENSQIAMKQKTGCVDPEASTCHRCNIQRPDSRTTNADMARVAVRLAARVDDGDIIDNEALGHPFKCIGKKDSERQCRVGPPSSDLHESQVGT